MKNFARITAILMLSACASAPTGQAGSGYSPLLSSETRPPAVQPCELSSRPADLPDPDLLISPAAVKAMPPFVGTGTGTPSYAVVEVSYDSIGDLQAPRMIEGNLDDASTQKLLDALTPHFDDGTSQSWSVLLRVDGGAVPAVRIGRSEHCVCALLNRHEVTRMLTAGSQRITDKVTGGRQHNLIVMVRSDSLGTILEKRLERISVNQEVNALVIRTIEEMEIVPPRLNRRSITGWSRLPITVSFHVGTQPGGD